MAEIIAAVIGGFLAAGTGWFLQNRAEKDRTNKTRHLLTTAICDDLQHAITLYDKVDDEWEKTKTVWFATLNELRESRQTYQNSRDWIVLFKNADLRKKIFRYYLRSSDLINNLEYQQRRKYELETKFNDLVRDIKYKSPQLTQEDAMKVATSYMTQEDAEYHRLKESVPENVKKLDKFKSEAKELVSELQHPKNP
ncbi:MAG: hypothetical protein ABIN45_00070 [Gammaproteobacteria bacterium]